MPLRTLPPRWTVTGSGSPVSADSSTIASSLTTIPSTGTTSPARTSTTLVDGDLVDRHLDELVAAANERRPRRTLDQRGQLAPGTPVRRLLERVAAREHQRDDGSGEVLAERERSGHRDERDRVDADVAAQQRTQHRPASAARAASRSSPPRASRPAHGCRLPPTLGQAQRQSARSQRSAVRYLRVPRQARRLRRCADARRVRWQDSSPLHLPPRPARKLRSNPQSERGISLNRPGRARPHALRGSARDARAPQEPSRPVAGRSGAMTSQLYLAD